MKKLTIQIIAFTFLALASFLSYTYLHHISTHEHHKQDYNTLYTPVQEEETPEQEILLLDVALMNKLIEGGKKLSGLGL